MNYFLSLLVLFQIVMSAEDPFQIFSVPKSGTHLIKSLHLYATGMYLPHSHLISTFPDALQKKDHKYYLVFRDPRDCIISFINWVNGQKPEDKRARGGPNWDLLTMEQKISRLVNFEIHNILTHPIPDIAGIVDRYKNDKNVLVCRFEDFIGEKGGGCAQKQKASLKKMLYFIYGDEPFSEKEIALLAEQSHGKMFTFRAPGIGKWKRYFSEKNKEDFKNNAWGEALIRLGYEKDSHW